MKNLPLVEFCQKNKLKLTELRNDVYSILFNKNKPLGAYDILDKLKKTRAGAEPTTVYRVLEWLVAAKLVHRIEAQNTYVCCSKFETSKHVHQAVLLSCKSCSKSYEYENRALFQSLKKFSDKHHLKIDDTIIELSGLCETCHHK